MPVPRRLWQPILVWMPAWRARRSIIFVHVALAHPVIRQPAVPPVHRAEQGSGLLLGDAGSVHVLVEIRFEVAVLLVQPEPQAPLLHVAVFEVEGGGRADAAEGVELGGDQGAIAQSHDGRDVDGIEELARFGGGEDRRLIE